MRSTRSNSSTRAAAPGARHRACREWPAARVGAMALLLACVGMAAAEPLPAAAAVSAGPGSPPARQTTCQGLPALQFTCPFSTGSGDRCSWDVPVNWNLRTSPGVALQLLCTDASPISQFNVYVHAGGTWHAAKASLGTPGRWETVQVLKTDTSPEGPGRGWGQVDRVRVAAWRGGNRDTTLYLASLERLTPNVTLAVLRASSTVASAERGPAHAYARNVMAALASAGIMPACIEDVDAATTGFAGYRLVLVPYHPDLPADLTRRLTDFVEGGGRVVGFYNLPPTLGRTLGVTTGRYVRAADLPGGIAGMQFARGAVQGLPESLRQDSGNVLDLVPAGHGMQCVGWWQTNDGRKTAQKAAVIGERGAWFGHVYLARDTINGRRLLLAVTGHFLPEIWRRAAAHQLQTVTDGISTAGVEATVEHLLARAPANAASQSTLRQAESSYRSARAQYQAGRYADCVVDLDRCRDQLARGVMLLQSAPSREFRGAWCHRGYGIAGWTWAQTARQMAASGLNTLFVNVATGAQADYPSAVLDPSPTLRGKGDQLGACLAACTPRGIKVHAWKLCFNLGQDPPADILARLRRDGRLQRGSNGEARNWLCPSHPENRLLEARAAAELVAKYPALAGVHLDFIRFPSSEGCTCDACRRGFEKSIGRRVDPWPEAVRREATLARLWADYRRQVITECVRRVAESVRQVRADAQVSAAVFSNWSSARDSVAQDWVLWAQKHYLDFVCPMNYHTDAEAQKSDVQRQLAWVRGTGVAVYPGIGVSTGRLEPIEVIRQINVTRAGPTGGFVLFELNRREAQDVLPALAPALGQK